jgi:ferrochelatase
MVEGAGGMEKTAVLLVNLGTPNAPDTRSVRRYLSEFLSDPRVIDLPRWEWLPILHGIILRIRPKKSAELYRRIWTQKGSPLLYYCRRQQQALQQRLATTGLCVSLAMTYGAPSMQQQLDSLFAWGMRRLIVVPLFPQYSSTTTASVWDCVQRAVGCRRTLPEISFIHDYPNHPLLIRAIAERIERAIEMWGRPDALILSYHGIPVRYAQAGDEYPQRCRITTEALRQKRPDLRVIESFQSKFGHEAWLRPSTADMLKHLTKEGIRSVFVCAPGFTADCLETLNELAVENAALFLRSGGRSFHYIPAVNDSPCFIDCLEQLVRNRLPLQTKI